METTELKPKIQISNNWRNKIEIKHLFTDDDDTSSELTAEICDSLVKQLTAIKEKEAKGNLHEDYKNDVDNKLFDVIDHFEFLSNLANGDIEGSALETKIPIDEWEDYGFNGNFQEWINDYLTELYNLGDERVITNNNISEKFLWIG